MGFVFVPFILISQLKLNQSIYNKILHSILLSTLFLSLLSLYYYKSLLGVVGRISLAISRDENYISPLALSYCGALGIGLGIIYLVTNKSISRLQKLTVLLVIIFSLIPFFLGASRG